MTTFLSDSDLLSRLIAFDSTSHRSNRPIAEFLCDYLDRAGARIDLDESDDGEKVNVVARVGPEVDDERRGLVLSAHMDVVPAGDGWNTDPFTLSDGGDRWFGRGTADMKGFLALATNAAALDRGDQLRAPLMLVFTYDEELGCLGAEHLARHWGENDPLPVAAIVGEPTRFEAVRLHKGHLKARLLFHGVSAHSGYPHLGSNAIEPAGRAITALSALRQELASERPRHHEHFPATPFVALNVARVRGGSAVNIVPERCEIDIGLRLLPEMELEPVLERLRSAIATAAGDARWELEVLGAAPPMLLGEDAPIYRAVCELTEQTRTVSASFGTDACWLQELGLDCVVFGPGNIEVAHKPDEHLPKADLVTGKGYLEQLIQRFCG